MPRANGSINSSAILYQDLIIYQQCDEAANVSLIWLKVAMMRSDYDFSRARRNAYAARLKKQITIRLDQQTIKYFKMVSRDMGVTYQTLINLYLRECAAAGKRLSLKGRSATGARATRD